MKLQGRYIDVAQAYREVSKVKITVGDLRSNVDTFHARVYAEAKQLAQDVHVDESIPRLASRQQHRSNITADSYSEYYCRNLTIPLLDHLLTELNTRFDKKDSVVELMQLLPSVIASNSDFLSPEKFEHVNELYSDDLPSFVCFHSELDLWQHKWKANSELAFSICTPEKALEHADADFFPNIQTLLCIMGTLPVTSCECERSISMLKLIKSPLRSTMGQGRLNGLAMLHYHRTVDITPEEVVNEFAIRHPRRMLL